MTRQFGRACAALLLCLALAGPAPAQTGEAVGTVQALQGAVTVLRGGGQLVLEPGASVFRGDRIVTSGRGQVRLEFVDGSVLAVGPGTVVEVSEYAASEAGTLDATLTLFLGILRATVSSDAAAADFDVRTQAAVASVRSTEWTVEVGEDPHTAVFVIEGAVLVEAVAGGEVLLEAGEGTDVDLGGQPSGPVEWGAPRIRRTLRLTDVR
jgi:hypothetical protein